MRVRVGKSTHLALILRLSTAGRGGAGHPEPVGGAVVWRGRTRWGDGPLDRRDRAHTGDEGSHVLFVPVGGVIPDYALPVEDPARRGNTTADGAGNLAAAPGRNPGFLPSWSVAGFPAGRLSSRAAGSRDPGRPSRPACGPARPAWRRCGGGAS